MAAAGAAWKGWDLKPSSKFLRVKIARFPTVNNEVCIGDCIP
jgi:hypothetical protein